MKMSVIRFFTFIECYNRLEADLRLVYADRSSQMLATPFSP